MENVDICPQQQRAKTALRTGLEAGNATPEVPVLIFSRYYLSKLAIEATEHANKVGCCVKPSQCALLTS